MAEYDFRTVERLTGVAADKIPAYGGIKYARIEKQGLQWPCPTKDHPGTTLYTDRSQAGNIFMTFHHQDTLTNILTSGHRCRIAGTPEYKSCAVQVEPWRE